MTDYGSPPAKTTLFCGVCGHASPPDGDWKESLTTTDGGDRLVLACPDCGTALTRRPAREARTATAVAGD